jgi:hypothetical protein
MIRFLLGATDVQTCTGQSFIPDLYNNLRDPIDQCAVKITKFADILVLLANVVQILLALSGIVAAGFIIWGGFNYMMSSGEPARVKKAKDIIVNAIVGLVLIMLSFAIVGAVSGQLNP